MPVRYYYSINDMLRYALTSQDKEFHIDSELEVGLALTKDSFDLITPAYCLHAAVVLNYDGYGYDTIGDEFPELFSDVVSESIRDKFFRKMINRTFNNTIAISDVELDWTKYPIRLEAPTDYYIQDAQAAKNFEKIFGGYLARLAQFFDSTYKRYALILSAYENKLDTYQKALARVGSDSTHETRFNDTPQDTATPAADTHLTTYTRDTTESSSDMNTIMTRISELEAKMSDVYKNWTDEYINQFSVI